MHASAPGLPENSKSIRVKTLLDKVQAVIDS
jgi:hypothetical protein